MFQYPSIIVLLPFIIDNLEYAEYQTLILVLSKIINKIIQFNSVKLLFNTLCFKTFQ